MGCNFFESLTFMFRQAEKMPLRALLLVVVCLIVVGGLALVLKRRRPPAP